MYNIEIKLVSNNGYFTPAEARDFYGRYSRDGIAVHWWNEPHLAGTHDQTVAYLASQADKGNVSANYVLSDTKITLLVNPDNVAFASGSGNPTTISIEFDPRLGDEGYRKGGWLINELEERYSKRLAIDPHSKWVATSCPGTIDLKRLRREADKFKNGGDMSAEKATKREVDNVFLGVLHRHVDPSGERAYVGKKIDDIITSVRHSAEFKEQDRKMRAYDKLVKENAELKKKLANATGTELDKETKDAIHKTNENVGWIRNVLNKVFK